MALDQGGYEMGPYRPPQTGLSAEEQGFVQRELVRWGRGIGMGALGGAGMGYYGAAEGAAPGGGVSGTITAADGSRITGRYVAGQGATRYNSGREGVDNRPWWQRALDWAMDAWNNPAGMLAGVVAAIVVGVAILATGGSLLAAVAVGAAAGFWMNLAAGGLDNAFGGAAGEAVGDWLGPGGVRVLRGVRDGIQIAGLLADAIMLGGAVLGAVRYARGVRGWPRGYRPLDEHFVGDSPRQYRPGGMRTGRYMDEGAAGSYETRTFYDQYGRRMVRTDYDYYVKGVHHHRYIYNPANPLGWDERIHWPGEWWWWK